ncbi:hypothetical protein [Stenotrophomonas maltophilia]|uniref:hypothetical protein n=1 Tax=Stenotrophomonas maltophilia TaxID=40324 RepID=UPI0015E01D84|nr:hypothetical protein [Stenotrophomonas maltophilia]
MTINFMLLPCCALAALTGREDDVPVTKRVQAAAFGGDDRARVVELAAVLRLQPGGQCGHRHCLHQLVGVSAATGAGQGQHAHVGQRRIARPEDRNTTANNRRAAHYSTRLSSRMAIIRGMQELREGVGQAAQHRASTAVEVKAG